MLRISLGRVALLEAVCGQSVSSQESASGWLFMDDVHLETYRQYRIVAKQISMEVSSFDVGFGWAFHVFKGDAQFPSFFVIVKSLLGWRDRNNLERAIKLGEECVHSVIDRHENPVGTYCFRWEPGPESPMRVTEVECDDISTNKLRPGS